MCYAFNQRSYCHIYVFFFDTSFFPFVTTLCVHVSLWMHIIMIVVYLETYTHERSHMPIGIIMHRGPSFYSSLFFDGSEKNLPYECLFHCIASCALMVLSLIHISEPTRRTPISYAV